MQGVTCTFHLPGSSCHRWAPAEGLFMIHDIECLLFHNKDLESTITREHASRQSLKCSGLDWCGPMSEAYQSDEEVLCAPGDHKSQVHSEGWIAENSTTFSMWGSHTDHHMLHEVKCAGVETWQCGQTMYVMKCVNRTSIHCFKSSKSWNGEKIWMVTKSLSSSGVE